MTVFLKRCARIGLPLVAVLFVASLLLQAEPQQPVETWTSIGRVADARTGAAAVALPDGRSLIMGGVTTDGSATDTVAVYDPVGNASVLIGELIAARVGHTATLLADGRVLVVGGTVSGTMSADLELFDPSTGTSILRGFMSQPRSGHAAARLADGRVLIVGGTTTDGVLKTAETYDPDTGLTTPTTLPMMVPRTGASATTIIDGRVLVAGGNNGTQDLASAELFDPWSQTFTAVDTALSAPRSGHAAILLLWNNSVLIAGGSSNGVPQRSSDLFLPAQFPDPYSFGMGRFAPTGQMLSPRSGGIAGPHIEGYAFTSGGGAPDAEAYRFATIKTDKDDYAPGERAVITGSGWEYSPDPDQGFVTLVFQEDPAVHDDYVIQVKVQEDGTLRHSDWAPELHDLNVRFYLMAKQVTSQGERRAQTTFTDGNRATFADTAGGAAVSAFTPSLGTNVCRDAFVQSRQGNTLDAVSGDQTVTLSSSPAVTFYVGSGCGGSSVTTVTVLSGQASAVFSFKIASTGTYNIHGDAPWSGNSNDADASVTVNNDAPTDVALSSNTVTENQGSGTTVGTLSTTDLNASDTHTYTLVTGTGSTDNASFSITGNTLKTAASFDFETKNSYSIRVRTTDQGGLFFEKAFSIAVSNVNETPSAVSDSDAAANTVAENAANGTTTGVTGFASDVDSTVVYSLTNDAGGRFAIDSATGVVTVANGGLLDFESATSHSITIQAGDGEFSTSASFTIAVTNVNEAPSITSSATASVPENTTAVQTVTATDPDAGAAVAFSLVGGADQAKFSINNSTGALAFNAAPDFETPTDVGADNVYEVQVRASDGMLHDTKTVLVTVTNVNEAPSVTSSTTASVPENTTAVQMVTATDPDAGTTLAFSFVGGADQSKFTINSSTGALAFVSAPDFETPTDVGADNIYVVQVRVSDGELHDTQTVLVTVTNVNEAPSITSAATASVPENTTAVQTVTASDPDAATTLAFSIVGGADQTKFTINGTTGALTFNAAPDFETPTDVGADNIYEVQVRASDGELHDTQTVLVTVTNVNEAPSITSAATASVPENTTAVQTVTAIDPDAGTTLAFSLVGGVDQARFTINGSTGVLVFNVAPDFETPTDVDADNIYEVQVRASDGTLHDTKTVLVTVTNVNEAPSVTSSGAASVPENTMAVQTVTASDPDAGTTLTFSIVGGADQAKFTINSTTGVLVFNVAPDFETPTDVGANNVYEVQVRASDGTLHDTKTVNVAVTNVNEAPVLGALTNQSVGLGASVSFTATATDPDAGTTLVFSLSGAPVGAAINPSTGQFTWTPTLAQVGAHTFNVVVSDGVLSDSDPITIAVSYSFVGFAAPVANAPAFNVVNAGRVIPVKWQLQDTLGNYILNLATVNSITYVQVPCASETLDNVITGTADTSGASGLRITGNDYIFTWQTEKSFSNKCFELRIALNDGSPHIAKFKFTK